MNRKKWIIIILAICLCLAILNLACIYQPRYSDIREYEALISSYMRTGNYEFCFPFEHEQYSKSVTVIHDADWSLHGLNALTGQERSVGIRSVIFVRPNQDYLEQSIGRLQELERDGWRIGIHYDCLSRCNGNFSEAITMFIAQVDYLRSFFNVTLTSYHGDNYNFSITNYDLYVHYQNVWENMGLKEVYAMNFSGYISDSNHVWSETNPLSEHVLIQLHTDWW